jgi:hypothetical protein
MNEFIINTLTLLQRVEQHASTPEQLEALKNSKLTLHLILGRGESGEFAEFLKSRGQSYPPPFLSFTTKEEADAWLRNHPAPPHGATIEAAGESYTVAYRREPDFRKLLPLPSKEEMAQLEATEEEGEAEEEVPPPSPSHGTRIDFFDCYKRTLFYLYELEQPPSSPEELMAIWTAKIAFDFIGYVGEWHGFEEYMESIRAPRNSRPLQSFATREDADSWLEHQPEPLPPAVVAIGSELFSVGYNRRRGLRLLIRIPPQQELDAGAP